MPSPNFATGPKTMTERGEILSAKTSAICLACSMVPYTASGLFFASYHKVKKNNFQEIIAEKVYSFRTSFMICIRPNMIN